VLTRRVRKDSHSVTARRLRFRWMSAFVSSVVLGAIGTPLFAQTTPSVSVGGGVQTSFVHTDTEDADSTDTFPLNSVRLYVSGTAAPKIKFMFNTEYNGATNAVGILDAAAQFEMAPALNIWVGRFIAPSDRANLYGPYYSHHWAVFTDGVQDGYPFVSAGRSNGAMYWGQFGKVKGSIGAFDGASQTADDTVVGAARVQVDFWDQEAGYYLNGTYYGDKNLLALGGAVQWQGSDRKAYNVDFLLERKVSGGGVFSVEAQWNKYDFLGGYSPDYGVNDGGYILGAFMFPQLVGVGRFEVLGKFAKAQFSEGLTLLDVDHEQKTTEINLNYVIRQFNARVMVFFKDTNFDAVRPDFKQFGVGIQLQI
jgi:hypothetical protein